MSVWTGPITTVVDAEVESPYHAGNNLNLRLDRGLFSHQVGALVRAKVVSVFGPVTMSPVMKILVGSPADGLSGIFALKMSDCRFTTERKADDGVGPWSIKRRKLYRDFVYSETGMEYLNRLSQQKKLHPNHPPKAAHFAKSEVFYFESCRREFGREVDVYDRLKDAQGIQIPRLHALYFSYKGIIIQHIYGYNLAEASNFAPEECWQEILDSALSAISLLCDHDIRNNNVHCRNFVVSEQDCRVFMIDFAQCKLRSAKMGDEKWERKKLAAKEEIEVGPGW